MDLKSVVSSIKNRDKRVIAKVITLIESDDTKSEVLLSDLSKEVGNAYRIGITGPPGAGKSTITNQLTKLFRAEGKSVGIIAVDPTSPFTGGALLGDRVRMNDIGIDEGVFIRSMATRGSLGGLSKKASECADILDVAGYDIIIYETVGVGQSELDIAENADCTIVVLVPESGDSVQAMKAGLMEIADIFVMNKGDRPGSDNAITAVKSMMQLKAHDEKSWFPNVIKAIAQENKGIDEIYKEIFVHKDYLLSHNILSDKRNKRDIKRLKEVTESKLISAFWKLLEIDENKMSEIVKGSEKSIFQISDELVKKIYIQK